LPAASAFRVQGSTFRVFVHGFSVQGSGVRGFSFRVRRFSFRGSGVLVQEVQGSHSALSSIVPNQNPNQNPNENGTRT
jgi:hypothetical protein